MKIKQCPFCGSDAVTEQYSSDQEHLDWQVGCDGEDTNCFGWLPRSESYDTEDEAIIAWNKRA
ncbi:MAG: hypothetical protein DRN17_03625 [Thermoplasmata archaeon]|nr:MAG: hypothetical protein DRN17_03625 [Thermoplasmata archaeon]